MIIKLNVLKVIGHKNETHGEKKMNCRDDGDGAR
jgi:hypothetical protein